jgi:hypothetical protein
MAVFERWKRGWAEMSATRARWRAAALARRARRAQETQKLVIDRKTAAEDRLIKLYEQGLELHDEIDSYERDGRAYVSRHRQEPQERILEWLGDTARVLCKSDLPDHADRLVAEIPPIPTSDHRHVVSEREAMHRRVDVFLGRLALTLHEVYRLEVSPRKPAGQRHAVRTD